MKIRIPFTLFLLLSLTSFSVVSQIRIPEEFRDPSQNSSKEPKVSELYQRYFDLKSNPDSLNYRKSKKIGRWFYNNASRLTVYSDSAYDFEPYNQAMREMVENGLICSHEDGSEWESVGPNYVGQGNGLVDAVYYTSDYPNEILIGTFASGIFRSLDHGNSWTCVTDTLSSPVIGVRQIIADPFNPDYLIALTGNKSGLDPIQTGYLISTDRGANWSIGPDYFIGEHFQYFAFDPSVPSRLYGITTDHLLLSEDNGQSWTIQLPLPADLLADLPSENRRTLQKIVVSSSSIALTNIQGDYVGFWTGQPDFSSIYTINWSSNKANDLVYEVNTDLIAPDDLPGTINVPYADQTPPVYDYNTSVTSLGCIYSTTGLITYPNYDPSDPVNSNDNPFYGVWCEIKTNGWVGEFLPTFGANYVTCVNTNTHDKEILHYFTTGISKALLLDDIRRAIKLNCHIPAGVHLKVYYSPYQRSSIAQYEHFPHYICNLPDLDYSTIFSNLIYEYDALTDIDIDVFQNFDIQASFESIIAQNGLDNVGGNFYFMLEFDNSIYVPGTKFRLNNFDIRGLYNEANFVNVSNAVGNRYYLHVRGDGYSAFWRTVDAGATFQLANTQSALTESGDLKDELVASVVDPDVYYRGETKGPYKATFGMGEVAFDSGSPNGKHADYRSSCITTDGTTDFVLWGNDGGVAESADILTTTPQLNSLNGDLAINMIYNLDLTKDNSIIAIGLQDNKSAAFEPFQPGWTQYGLGDGSVAKTREVPNHYIFGDPQYGGLSALDDFPTSGTTLGIVSDVSDIIKGESFLGVRLEPFRFDDSKFVKGLQRKDGINSHVIINEGIDVTSKVEVPGSVKIGPIGICQRMPNNIYLADQIHKDLGDPTLSPERLFKTTNGGTTSADWEKIDPVMHFVTPGGSSNSLAMSMLFPWDFINALGVDHLNSSLVYIGMSGVSRYGGDLVDEYQRVFVSTDGGYNFIDWSDGLPSLPVNFLLPVESENHLIFCAMDGGIYFRHDGMTRWECFSKDLPKTRITDLHYSYCSKELYASTYGRGVWRTPVNLPMGAGFEEEIAGIELWDTDRDLHNDLILKSGAVLTIMSTVHIDADRKIIVEPGARLVLNGGTLTNECGKFWAGIEVWGDSAAPQYAIYQGTVHLMNDAKIEFAQDAIRLWEPDNWARTGGIVRATEAHFINNKRDIEFVDYTWHLAGVEQANESYFEHCEFRITDDYGTKSAGNRVEMLKVNGVYFKACDFADDRVGLDKERGKGILSMDSKYKVIGGYIGSGGTSYEYFDSTDFINSSFTNLHAGVHAMNSNSQSSISVDQTSFVDCKYGIRTSVVDNAIITRNYFDRTLGSDWFDKQRNIYMHKSSAFMIEGNVMTSNNTLSSSIGIIINNAGKESNRVYKNKISDLTFATVSVGKNRNNDSPISPTHEGLEFLCNNYKDNETNDELMFGIGANQGPSLVQGKHAEPAGNTFEYSSTATDFNLLNTIGDNISYLYYDNTLPTNPEMPYSVSANVYPLFTFNQALCETSFNVVDPGDLGGNVVNQSEMQLLGQFNSLKSNFATNKAMYENNMINGDRQEFYDAVAAVDPSTAEDLKTQLLGASPYLSDSLLRLLSTKVPEGFSEEFYLEVVTANAEVTHDPAFLMYLEGIDPALSLDLINNIRSLSSSMTGRTVELHEVLKLNNDMTKIANQMLKKLVQDSLGIDNVAFNEWIIHRNDFMREVQITDNFIYGGEKDSCKAHLSLIDVQVAGLTGDERVELENYANFKRDMLLHTNSRGTIEGLQGSIEGLVRTYATSATGYAQVQAQNLLCFFLNECEEAPEIISGERSASYDDEEELYPISVETDDFNVRPNPSDGHFIVDLGEKHRGMVRIYDLKGTEVYNQSFDGEYVSINVNYLNKSVYLLRIELANGEIKKGKVMIH